MHQEQGEPWGGKRERERVSGRKENPSGKYSGVGDGEGGPNASVVAENPRRYFQGVGGVVKFLRGTDTPRV